MRKMTMMCMAALLLMAVSCKKEKANETYSGEGFRATTESHTGEGDSKTQLNSDLSVTWCSGDEIKVFNSKQDGKKFSAASAGTAAFFNPEDEVTDAFFTAPYTAFYPYGSATGTNQISLEGTQHYTKTDGVLTFAPGENPMAAQSGSKELSFKNLCGILKFQLYSGSPSCKVKSLRVTSLKSGEQLWGTGTVTFNGADATLGTLANGGQSITLDCGEGVNLGTVDAPTEFLVVIPDGALSEGFTVTVTDADDKVWSKTATADNTITKSKIKAMPKQAVATHEPVTPVVTTTVGCVDCTYTFSGKVTVNGTRDCEYGFVYAKTADNDNPTIGGTSCVKFKVNTENLSGSKDFTADLSTMNLEQDVEYTVKAYGICDAEAYGTTQTYVYSLPKSLPSSWTDKGGKNPHPFTVESGKVVYFSQGNLQYTTTGSHSVASGGTATGTWRFAEHQLDIIGAANANAAQTYTGWIDLFGWGTSGYHQSADSYNVNYQPWATSTSYLGEENNYYGYGPSTGVTPEGPYSMTQSAGNISGSYYDWGVYNAINNGGNQAGKWRTLNMSEWEYLIEYRPNCADLYGEGMVGNCTPGLIILPDDWKWEGDVAEFGPSVTEESRRWKPGMTVWSNVYSYSEWSQMEAAGAVFLPAAGERYGTSVSDFASVSYLIGSYWSSSDCSGESAYGPAFVSGNVHTIGSSERYYGFSVRLVSDIPPVNR